MKEKERQCVTKTEKEKEKEKQEDGKGMKGIFVLKTRQRTWQGGGSRELEERKKREERRV